MKVELQLEVSQTQIFDLLTTSILKDIETTTGKEVSKEEINGYQYTKSITTKLGTTNSVNVVISSYIEPTVYEAKVISDNGDYIFRYDITHIDETHCHVAYTETYDSPKWFLRLNHSLFSMMYMKKSKNRLIGSIRYMEHMILHPELMEAQASSTNEQELPVESQTQIKEELQNEQK